MDNQNTDLINAVRVVLGLQTDGTELLVHRPLLAL